MKYPASPEIEAEHSENPARYLFGCSTNSASYLLVARLNGVDNVDYLGQWVAVERRAFGARHGPMKAIRRRRDDLLDGESDGRDETRAHVDEKDRAGDGDGVEEDADREAGSVDVDDDPLAMIDVEQEPTAFGYDDVAEFERETERAYQTAKMFDSADAVRERLDQEVEGESRKHVISALNRRLDDFRGEESTDNNATSTEVSA